MTGAAAVRVTAVFPAFNSAHVIGRALAAVPRETPCIVVDNASRDASAAAARAARADALIIQNPRNEGFGRACNIGLRASRTEFAAIINPDLFLASDCLALCVAAADAHPQVALFGADEAPDAAAQPGAIRPQAALSGSMLLMRRAAIAPLGYFDEAIFMYFEDADLCLRARLAGLGVAAVAGARAEHLSAASTAPAFDNLLEKQRLWGMACAYFAARHPDQPEGRQAARKLRRYALRAALPFVGGADRAILRARLEGARRFRAEGAATMFDNRFVANAAAQMPSTL